MQKWPHASRVRYLVFDFDGIFTDNKVHVTQDGIESVRCDRGDGLGILLLRNYCSAESLGLRFFVLSKEPNPAVLARTKKLKMECHHGVDDKLSYLRSLLDINSSEERLKDLVYLGNDLNDLEVMKAADYSFAPADAHPRIKQIASEVLPEPGGEGFVRNFIERFIGLPEWTDEKVCKLLLSQKK